MLNIVRYGSDSYDSPALLVLGCFDGLHIGHDKLIGDAAFQAKINGLDLGVMTFAEGKGEKQLLTLDERLEILEQKKVKFVLLCDFDDDFKQTSAASFLERVEEKVNVKAYMCGEDFRFGAGAKGKCSTLKNHADEDESVWFKSVKDVERYGEKVSSGSIRKMLEAGDMELAGELLGYSYFVTGEVTKGDERGRELGFPTCNILFPEKKADVRRGVYRAMATTPDGERRLAVASYGSRPTFDEDNELLEVHIPGFDGDLYGETLKVEFLNFLRDIRKFDTKEELIEQMTRDAEALEAVAADDEELERELEESEEGL